MKSEAKRKNTVVWKSLNLNFRGKHMIAYRERKSRRERGRERGRERERDIHTH